MKKIKEIIRKFKVEEIPFALDDLKPIYITQYYLKVNTNYEVRIKKCNNQYTQAEIIQKEKDVIKKETEMTKEQFDIINQCFVGDPIEKKRYIVSLPDNLLAEIDVHQGKTAGLISAKVKFKDEIQAYSFIKPDWFGEDITNDLGLRSKYLAVKPKQLIDFKENDKIKIKKLT